MFSKSISDLTYEDINLADSIPDIDVLFFNDGSIFLQQNMALQ